MRKNSEKSYRERVLKKSNMYNLFQIILAQFGICQGKNGENLYEKVLKEKCFPAGLCINIKIDGESSKFMKD